MMCGLSFGTLFDEFNAAFAFHLARDSNQTVDFEFHEDSVELSEA